MLKILVSSALRSPACDVRKPTYKNMNSGIFKLVFSRIHHMLVAAADFASARGNGHRVRVRLAAGGRSAAHELALRTLVAAMLYAGTLEQVRSRSRRSLYFVTA